MVIFALKALVTHSGSCYDKEKHPKTGGAGMILKKENAENALLSLLRQWCDALIRRQIDAPDDPSADGGLLCPACGRIHGRSADAVAPLLFLADRTGDKTYLRAARRLFAWGKNMLCEDGSMRNDTGSDWRGVTVFQAIALHDALARHGHLLQETERAAWTLRLRRMGGWLAENLTVGAHAYINYYAANACAMALLGNLFGDPVYLARAKELADYCFSHVSENGLLYGEGSPHDAQTKKGCFAIDAGGYNAEESLPCLTRYAEAVHDTHALERCRALWHAALHWMLPDGAWDNSVGTRAFKWTYWGSRTSDGCQDALFALGRNEPVFGEAAWRNFLLLRECTHGGLLYGGMDLQKHGDAPCIHHTFCHAKALAAALDTGLYDFERMSLPADDPPRLRYYPENDTYRIACGGWRADVTGYDADNRRAGHASGGSVSLLWNRRCGAVIACGMVDYALAEPFNQQIPLDENEQRSPCPRIEAVIDGVRYGQHYDFGASLRAKEENGCVTVRAHARLCDAEHRPAADSACTLLYTWTDKGLRIDGSVAGIKNARYILPLLSEQTRVNVSRGTLSGEPEPIFCLSPGFAGREYTVLPDETGAFTVEITL